jgi:hypothetical protein
MDITFLPDEHEVTIRWTSTEVTDHEHTFTYGELREAVNSERRQRGHALHPDITRDLDLLEESFLGEYEEDSHPAGLDRDIDTHDLPGLPELPVHTVTVAGDERHYGEPASTYVLHAPTPDTARTLVIEHFTTTCEKDREAGTDEVCDPDVIVVEGPWHTFPGAPHWPKDLPGRIWTDVREDEQLLERAYRMAAAQ